MYFHGFTYEPEKCILLVRMGEADFSIGHHVSTKELRNSILQHDRLKSPRYVDESPRRPRRVWSSRD
jgi:hypothetical protein